MGEREQFLKEYQEQVLDTLTLPPEWSVRYTVQSCLKDGERQVYLLRDQAGRQAVLKTQPAGREDTLRQEYDLLRELHHRQIPRPLDYLEWEGREYLVREYVEGISLAEWVDTRGPRPPRQVRETALSLCRVLEDLHSQNPPVPGGAAGGHGVPGHPGYRAAGAVRIPADGPALRCVQPGDADALFAHRRL